MAFFRQRMQQTPGFNGGSLEELLARQAHEGMHRFGYGGGGIALDQEPQILTPQNQQAITRPRTVEPQQTEGKAPSFRDMLSQPQAAPVEAPVQAAPNAPFGSSGEPFGAGESTRPRRTQMRDYIADDSAYLRDLESQPRNWKDKTLDAVRGLNAHFNPGSGPGAPSKRERNIAQVQGRLRRDLTITKEKSAADLREANILAGQDRIRQGDERLAQGDKRLKQQSQEMIARILNSREEFDPEAPENQDLVNAARAAGVPVAPKKRGQQLKWVQNAATGAWETIAGDKTTGKSTSSAVTTPEGTQLTTQTEGNLNRDVRTSEGRLNRANSRGNALIMAGGQVARMGDPEVHKKNIAEIESDIAGVDEQIKTLTDKRDSGGLTPSEGTALNALPREKSTLERERRDEREKLGKIESAQSGPVSPKGVRRSVPRGTSAPASKGSFNLGAWKAAHPEATKEQIQSQRSKAKARQLAIEE